MGRTAWDDTECPSHIDFDCGDIRYAPKNIDNVRGKPTGTAHAMPEM